MTDPQSNYILITGASSGIGEGFARHFASKGNSLILIARRKERLEKLKEKLGTSCQIEILPSDLSEECASQQLFDMCKENGWNVQGLINNAGFGYQNDFIETESSKILQMLRVNMEALTMLSHLFGKEMSARKSGFILNIASTAGFQAVPLFGVYAATKAYVIHLSEALHEELAKDEVKISCLCPGPVATEFQEKANLSPRFFSSSQSVEEVVRQGILAIEKNRTIHCSSWFQWVGTSLSWLTPRLFKRKIAYHLLSQ